MSQALTPKEAAERLRVAPYTVLRWAREGKIASSKTAKTVRFTEEGITEFLSKRDDRPVIATSPGP